MQGLRGIRGLNGQRLLLSLIHISITAYIVQVAMGDLPHASIGYQSIFAAGLVLFVMTLGFNLIGHVVRKKYREQY